MLDVGVAKCPLCEIICYCTGSNGTEISVRIAGCLLLRGFECIEVWSGHSEMSVTMQVSAVEGYLLSGVFHS